MLLEFFNSLDWVLQTTIILWLVYLIVKWFGDAIIAIGALIHPIVVLLICFVFMLIGLSTAFFTVWSVFHLLNVLW